MYTEKEWLIIVRKLLLKLGNDTTKIDEYIEQLPTEEAQKAYKDTLSDILNEPSFRQHGGMENF